jgi:nicotinamidase-related amidase
MKGNNKTLTMKKLILIISFFMASSIYAQQNQTALLIIDIQYFYYPGGSSALINPEPAGKNARKLLEYFRENKMLVVHIRHNAKQGAEIHEDVKPLPDEKVISKDHVNSFRNTDLLDFLNEHKIKNLVICGMQTHMCVEAATRAGADLGFNCTLIHDACATKDLKFGDVTVKSADVHYSTLSTLKSYAKVLDLETFLKEQ